MLDTIFTWIIDAVGEALAFLIDALLGTLSLSLSTFYNAFPIVATAYTIFRAIGIGLTILIAATEIFKYLTAGLSEVSETPPKILLRAAIAGFLVYFGGWGMELIVDFARIPYEIFEEMIFDTVTIGADATASSWITELLDFIATNGTLTAATLLLELVLLLLIAYNVLKLMLEVFERFAMVGLLCYASPLIFPTFASQGTSAILKKYMSMFIGGCVLMTLSVWSLNIVLAGFSYNDGAGEMTTTLQRLMLTLAMCKIAQRIDTYMQQLGIGVATTGGNMLDDIIAAARTASFVTRRAAGGTAEAGKASHDSVLGSNLSGTTTSYSSNKVGGAVGAGIGAVRSGVNAYRNGESSSGVRSAIKKGAQSGFSGGPFGKATAAAGRTIKTGVDTAKGVAGGQSVKDAASAAAHSNLKSIKNMDAANASAINTRRNESVQAAAERNAKMSEVGMSPTGYNAELTQAAKEAGMAPEKYAAANLGKNGPGSVSADAMNGGELRLDKNAMNAGLSIEKARNTDGTETAFVAGSAAAVSAFAAANMKNSGMSSTDELGNKTGAEGNVGNLLSNSLRNNPEAAERMLDDPKRNIAAGKDSDPTMQAALESAYGSISAIAPDYKQGSKISNASSTTTGAKYNEDGSYNPGGGRVTRFAYTDKDGNTRGRELIDEAAYNGLTEAQKKGYIPINSNSGTPHYAKEINPSKTVQDAKFRQEMGVGKGIEGSAATNGMNPNGEMQQGANITPVAETSNYGSSFAALNDGSFKNAGDESGKELSRMLEDNVLPGYAAGEQISNAKLSTMPDGSAFASTDYMGKDGNMHRAEVVNAAAFNSLSAADQSKFTKVGNGSDAVYARELANNEIPRTYAHEASNGFSNNVTNTFADSLPEGCDPNSGLKYASKSEDGSFRAVYDGANGSQGVEFMSQSAYDNLSAEAQQAGGFTQVSDANGNTFYRHDISAADAMSSNYSAQQDSYPAFQAAKAAGYSDSFMQEARAAGTTPQAYAEANQAANGVGTVSYDSASGSYTLDSTARSAGLTIGTTQNADGSESAHLAGSAAAVAAFAAASTVSHGDSGDMGSSANAHLAAASLRNSPEAAESFIRNTGCNVVPSEGNNAIVQSAFESSFGGSMDSVAPGIKEGSNISNASITTTEPVYDSGGHLVSEGGGRVANFSYEGNDGNMHTREVVDKAAYNSLDSSQQKGYEPVKSTSGETYYAHSVSVDNTASSAAFDDPIGDGSNAGNGFGSAPSGGNVSYTAQNTQPSREASVSGDESAPAPAAAATGAAAPAPAPTPAPESTAAPTTASAPAASAAYEAPEAPFGNDISANGGSNSAPSGGNVSYAASDAQAGRNSRDTSAPTPAPTPEPTYESASAAAPAPESTAAPTTTSAPAASAASAPAAEPTPAPTPTYESAPTPASAASGGYIRVDTAQESQWVSTQVDNMFPAAMTGTVIQNVSAERSSGSGGVIIRAQAAASDSGGTQTYQIRNDAAYEHLSADEKRSYTKSTGADGNSYWISSRPSDNPSSGEGQSYTIRSTNRKNILGKGKNKDSILSPNEKRTTNQQAYSADNNNKKKGRGKDRK